MLSPRSLPESDSSQAIKAFDWRGWEEKQLRSQSLQSKKKKKKGNTRTSRFELEKQKGKETKRELLYLITPTQLYRQPFCQSTLAKLFQ